MPAGQSPGPLLPLLPASLLPALVPPELPAPELELPSLPAVESATESALPPPLPLLSKLQPTKNAVVARRSERGIWDPRVYQCASVRARLALSCPAAVAIPVEHAPPADDELRVESPQGRCIVVPASSLQWTAVRSAGPGGQNVNKLATKIDLRFDLQGCVSVPAAAQARLRADPAVRFDARGCIIVTSQQARTQAGNLALARRKLAALLAAALDPPTPRRKTRPSAASRRRRLSDKRAQSERKAGRGRVHGE